MEKENESDQQDDSFSMFEGLTEEEKQANIQFWRNKAVYAGLIVLVLLLGFYAYKLGGYSACNNSEGDIVFNSGLQKCVDLEKEGCERTSDGMIECGTTLAYGFDKDSNLSELLEGLR